MPIPLEIIALNRIGFGHTSEEVAYIQKIGYEKFIEEQLNPKEAQDKICQQKISETSLLIEYNHKKVKTREERPLRSLELSPAQLWEITKNKPHYAEKIRPAQEVFVAMVLRAVYSRWQLREVLADFWHNHFNVSIYADERVAVLLPFYDREVIRKHLFGNFRQFLEAVAKSGSMLYYLDNAGSKASPANENYARELFELHTLGADNYKNDLYDKWKDVPKDAQGLPTAYIDEDVYEAARAFTGWTVADGSEDRKGGNLPNTGEFHYAEHWHDHYQKRVLATEIPHNQPALADGLKVLDILAYHSATAKHICTKLVRRLVSDNPPQALVNKVVEVWMKNQKSPKQLQEVVRTILLSEEFKTKHGEKVKTPLELLVSFWRATGAEIQPNMQLFWLLQKMGQQPFTYANPTGHPDNANFWLSTNTLMARWNTLAVLILEDWHRLATLRTDFLKMPEFLDKSCTFWASAATRQLLGYEAEIPLLANYLAQGGSVDEPPYFENEATQKWRIANFILLITQLPNFQHK